MSVNSKQKKRSLRACPFCSSQHLSIELRASAWNQDDEEKHVICNDCASSAPIYIWNGRAEKESPSVLSVSA